jgi:hypothetical protein
MTGPDDAVSGEARHMAADAMIRAARGPRPARIGELASEALHRERETMTPAEIRALAVTAIGRAQQVTRLMERLAVLLGDTEEDCLG